MNAAHLCVGAAKATFTCSNTTTILTTGPAKHGPESEQPTRSAHGAMIEENEMMMTDDEDIARRICTTMCREATAEEFHAKLAAIEAAKPEHGPGIDEPPVRICGDLGDLRWSWEREWCPIGRRIRSELWVYRKSGPAALVISGVDDELVLRAATFVVGRDLPCRAE